MGKNQRTTFAKLQRERARQAKQAEKRERRHNRRAGDEPVDPQDTPEYVTGSEIEVEPTAEGS